MERKKKTRADRQGKIDEGLAVFIKPSSSARPIEYLLKRFPFQLKQLAFPEQDGGMKELQALGLGQLHKLKQRIPTCIQGK
jgi:hypothetical protein